MKRKLIELLSEELVKRFNITFTSYEIRLSKGDSHYHFSFSKMKSIHKDGDTIVISLGSISDNMLLGRFYIFNEVLELNY